MIGVGSTSENSPPGRFTRLTRFPAATPQCVEDGRSCAGVALVGMAGNWDGLTWGAGDDTPIPRANSGAFSGGGPALSSDFLNFELDVSNGPHDLGTVEGDLPIHGVVSFVVSASELCDD